MRHWDTHGGPVGVNLPLTADLQLTGDGSFRPLHILTVACVHIERVVGINLATKNLSVLHAQTTGLTTFWPLSNIPAVQTQTRNRRCCKLFKWGHLICFSFPPKIRHKRGVCVCVEGQVQQTGSVSSLTKQGRTAGYRPPPGGSVSCCCHKRCLIPVPGSAVTRS